MSITDFWKESQGELLPKPAKLMKFSYILHPWNNSQDVTSYCDLRTYPTCDLPLYPQARDALMPALTYLRVCG